MSDTGRMNMNQILKLTPILMEDTHVDSYSTLSAYKVSNFIYCSGFYYRSEKKTLIKNHNAIYWFEEKAFIFYKVNRLNTIYLNSSLKHKLNWEKTINKIYPWFDIEWVSTEFFNQFIVSLENCKFKNLTEKRESLEKFKNWLSFKFVNNYSEEYAQSPF